MKLRKFSVAILDDRESGWKNAISVLFHDKYVKYNHASEIISRTTEFDFSIFSPDNDYSLKKAIKHIESGVDFDIYVIDIDLCENKFAYGYDYEKIAGLYFLDVTKLNNSPKILFSGSKETEVLFMHLSMFGRKRLTDIVPVRIEDQQLSDSHRQDKVRLLEKKIDTYLRKRQVEIISRQSSLVRKEIQNLVDQSRWDTALIPDNGKQECEEFWSIRTLFPKQVINIENKIQAPDTLPEGYSDTDRNQKYIDISKNYIISILKSEWRELIKKGFLNHPSNTKLDDLAIETVKDLEFKIEGSKIESNHYKLLTQYNNWNDFSGNNNLRDSIINDVQIEGFGLNCSYNAPSWRYEIENWVINFGIYPRDIQYLSYIVSSNRRHVNNSEPCLEIERNNDLGSLKFTWTYDALNEYQLKSPKLKEKIEGAFFNRNVLEDAGIADLIKIVCFRYRGGVEFRGGSLKIITTPQSPYNCSDCNEFIKQTKLIITLLKEGDYEDTNL